MEEEEGIEGIVAKAASSVYYLGNKFTPKKKSCLLTRKLKIVGCEL